MAVCCGGAVVVVVVVVVVVSLSLSSSLLTDSERACVSASRFLPSLSLSLSTVLRDVVKTRLQAQDTSRPRAGATVYRGFLHALRTIAKEEGVAALWKGLLPRLLRLAPGQAITWTVVMKVTGHFERRTLAGRAVGEGEGEGGGGGGGGARRQRC